MSVIDQFAAKYGSASIRQEAVWIFEPGIMQWPDDARNWDARAATWFTRHGILNDRCDYFCGPIGRAWHQQRRIDRAKDVIGQFVKDGKQIKIACHSNGDAIITAALQQMNWPHVSELHIFSGAGPADFEKCGFNWVLPRSSSKYGIEKIVVYVAGQDKALRLASTFLGRWLGYGTLGLKGPQNVCSYAASRVKTVVEPDYGHSTWFDPANFDKTMRRLVP